jgi:hypothetical protein
LDGLSDESGDVSAGSRLNEIFDVAGASYFAFGVLQVQRAPVAVRIDGVGDAHADDPGFAIRCLRRDGFHERGAAGIGVAECNDIEAAGGHARD